MFLPASESDFDIRKLECGDLKPVWDGLKEEEKGKEKLKIEQKRLEIELQNMDGEEIEDTSETDADLYGS